MAKSGKGKKKKKEKHDLIYIMNPNCGWCKKSDPVVESLIEKGYEITTLDVTKPEESERANEIKSKYNAQCGTPHFIDAETGNQVCGFREDVLEDWAKGEEIPAPPQPEPRDPGAQQQPQIENVKLEYIWLDGNSPKNIRSKVKYQRMNINMIQGQNIIRMIPPAYFDGSSTQQSGTETSDCMLSPVKAVPNPMDGPGRSGNPVSYIVLCEVLDSDRKPHKTNTRSILQQSMSVLGDKMNDMIIGFEQEYTLTDPITGKPIGWEEYKEGTPPPQGDYYCGVGPNFVKGRKVADIHAQLCNKAGVLIHGTNAEVMLSQWEYQTSPRPVLMAADDVILTRYILQRVAEDMNIAVSYEPKPVHGNWNGSGGHINFSTGHMRSESDIPYMTLLCSGLEKYHDEALIHYGENNDQRLTGEHETSSIHEYTWGEMDRSASVRIPMSTINNDGKGHLEDRRPASNIDPYDAFNYLLTTVSKVTEELLVTV